MVEEEREILKKKLEHQQHYQTEHAAKVEETKETIATLGKKVEEEDAELTKKGKGFQLKKLRSEARLLVLNSEAAELEKKIGAAKASLSKATRKHEDWERALSPIRKVTGMFWHLICLCWCATLSMSRLCVLAHHSSSLFHHYIIASRR